MIQSNAVVQTTAAGIFGNLSVTANSLPTIGLFSPSTNQLGFATNSVQQMVIDAGGNMGIGTTLPITKLDVVANTGFNIAARNLSNSNDTSLYASNSLYNISIGVNPNNGYIYSTNAPIQINSGYASGYVYVSTNNTERMRITNTGNVGIATTAVQTGYTFQVNGYQTTLNSNYTYLIPNTGGSAAWVKLGTFTASQAGNSCFIKVVTNQGFNASTGQQVEIYIRFETSNGSSFDANGFGGWTSSYCTNSQSLFNGYNVKAVGNAAGASATAYDIWIFLMQYTGAGSFYTVEMANYSGNYWTHSGITGTDPGAASSTVQIAASTLYQTANTIVFGTSVTERMRIDSNGNIYFSTAGTQIGSAKVSILSGTTNATQYTTLANTGGSTMYVNQQQTTSVSTAATVILATPLYATLALVHGSDGTNRFSDLVLMSVGTGTVNVISSLSAAGTPAARTYSQASSTFKLAMASGTYTVQVSAICMNS